VCKHFDELDSFCTKIVHHLQEQAGLVAELIKTQGAEKQWKAEAEVSIGRVQQAGNQLEIQVEKLSKDMQQDAADHTQIINQWAKELSRLAIQFKDLEEDRLHQAAKNATLQDRTNQLEDIITNLQERLQHVEDKTTQQELNL
jgi:cell division protein FtsB